MSNEDRWQLENLFVFLYGILMFAGAFNLALYAVGWWQARAPWCGVVGRSSESQEYLIERTAIAMPVYNEDADRVYLGVRNLWQSARSAGLPPGSHFFFLFDTDNAEVQRQEEEIYEKLHAEFGGIFRIRRKERTGFKAGNIRHFLTEYGRNYDFMLVLDADSVMSGETIKRMILRMQASPNLAILQSTIVPIRAVTPFARSTQYSLGRTMPLYARGLYWFFGKQCVYWGDNALIRIKPFMEHALLPALPGKPPLGGVILSQDIVEAALLGRAGWDVEWDVDNGGSFDELPANISTYGKRDRRWCQGNFQHFPFIFWRGMKWGHRLYFANGIFAYLAGPLLLLLMLLGFVRSISLPPAEGAINIDGRFLALLLGMLALPRALGLIRLFSVHKRAAREECDGNSVSLGWNGWKREVGSMALELGISILTAPLLFYLHARFVMEIVTGNAVSWKNQSRNPAERLSWGDAARLFWPAALLGAIWAGTAIVWAPAFLIYLAPALLSWIFSIPLAVATSSPEIGRFLVRQGFFPDAFSRSERDDFGLFSSNGLQSSGFKASGEADGTQWGNRTICPEKNSV